MRLCIAVEMSQLLRFDFMTCTPSRREKMTNPMTDLEAYTDEELEQVMARVLALARGEALNDAEVQQLWQIYEEIQRRRARPVSAA